MEYNKVLGGCCPCLQAKDYMRLSAVTRSCPLLISRVAVGGSATSWAVQEFSAQMRAVCKIAVHRQSNLASFLAQHGILLLRGCFLNSEFLNCSEFHGLSVPRYVYFFS